MIKYLGYELSEDVVDFITGMKDYVETNFGFGIKSSYCYVYVDPIEDHIEVKCDNFPIVIYSDIDEFLVNFYINNRKIIEVLEDFEYA